MASVAAGYGLRWAGLDEAAFSFQAFLSRGGWLWLPLWGAALALVLRLPRTAAMRDRMWLAIVALLLTLAPLVLRPVVPIVEPIPSPSHPASANGKAMAFRRWAYASAQSVANILPYTQDADPVVREQAVLALGINVIVSDIENAGPDRPSHFASSPLRDSLRVRLVAALSDPVAGVRAEAARALWKSPITFGPSPFAAETLAAMLLRRPFAAPPDRIAWLALDALAARYDERLARQAERLSYFAVDPSLSTAAHAALKKSPRH
jgi:hypothetical protein